MIDMKRSLFILTFLVLSFILLGQEKNAILYFVRPDNFAGKFMDLKIVINGKEVGSISNKSFFVHKTAISGNAKIVARAIGSPPKSLTITIEKGQKYYFAVGFTAMGKFIRQVSFSEVQNDIPDKDVVIEDNPKVVVSNKDIKAPEISISNPKVSRGFKLVHQTDQIKIEGRATDESGIFRIMVNGANTPFDANGNFQSLQSLIPGINEIKIVATDTQENTSEYTFLIESKSKTVVSGNIIKPAEKRVALIIGNADYKSAPLRNPVNDAVLMTSELKKLGFEVITVKNGSQNQMKAGISKFGELLAKDKNTVGLFYYAGHGLQIKGKNYLVPTDANITKEPDVEVYCVDLDGLLANLEYAGNNMNIIILDACRNNPFGRGFRSQAGNGLATVNAPVGTIIAFATAPGSVAADGDGQNGLYTQEFVKALSTPNAKIEDVFKKVRTQVKTLSDGKQIPWENSSIEGDFYFIRKD
jgi:hypothetical protein